MAKRKVEIPIPDGLVLGTMVRYYSNGWRTGLLDKWVNGVGRIMPIGKKVHISITEDNIEPIEETKGS
jgi:hypothetical protein